MAADYFRCPRLLNWTGRAPAIDRERRGGRIILTARGCISSSPASSLVDASVGNYQQRGFKNLMVSFGCTGGQHRSVYLAEQLARRLRGRAGVEVVVEHRELENLDK
jgi:hypothetical protein